MNQGRLAPFHIYLHTEGYRPRTVAAYRQRATAIIRGAHNGEPVKHAHNTQYAARAYLHYLEVHNYEEDPLVLAEMRRLAAGPPDEGLSSIRKKRLRQERKRRQQEARSFSDEDWRALRGAVTQSRDIVDILIDIMTLTALRSADLLLLRRSDLDRGATTGQVRLMLKGGEPHILPYSGAQVAWDRLRYAWRNDHPRAETVLEILSPGGATELYDGHPAYKQIASRLAELGRELGIDGRMNLHRIRRTVAVHALRETQDIIAVQQLLGHKSVLTTQRYLDEARPAAVAGLQQRLKDRYQ